MKKPLLVFIGIFFIVFLLLIIYKTVLTNFFLSLVSPLNQTSMNYNQRIALGSGDVNDDGKIDYRDTLEILQRQGTRATESADQYKDGKVNALDFAVVADTVTP